MIAPTPPRILTMDEKRERNSRGLTACLPPPGAESPFGTGGASVDRYPPASARYASGEDPRVGDVVRSVVADVPADLVVTAVRGIALGVRGAMGDAIATGECQLVRRAEPCTCPGALPNAAPDVLPRWTCGDATPRATSPWFYPSHAEAIACAARVEPGDFARWRPYEPIVRGLPTLRDAMLAAEEAAGLRCSRCHDVPPGVGEHDARAASERCGCGTGGPSHAPFIGPSDEEPACRGATVGCRDPHCTKPLAHVTPPGFSAPQHWYIDAKGEQRVVPEGASSPPAVDASAWPERLLLPIRESSFDYVARCKRAGLVGATSGGKVDFYRHGFIHCADLDGAPRSLPAALDTWNAPVALFVAKKCARCSAAACMHPRT